MGFFNKKAKGEPEQTAGKSSAQPSVKVKKHNETMASVLRESVVETVMADFKQNQSFIVQFHGKPYYVGLYFDTNRIGGLSKKESRNEDKGQLIESINGGHVVALITGELMETEAMVLVPTRMSLISINEYNMLRTLEFPLCYVSEDGEDIEVTDRMVTIEQCLNLVQTHGDVSQYLGDMPPGQAEAEAEMEAARAEEEPAEPIPEQEEEIPVLNMEQESAGLGGEAAERREDYGSLDDDSQAPFGEDPDYEQEPDFDEPETGAMDDSVWGDDDDDEDEDDDGGNPYADDDEDRVEEVSEEDYQRTLTRKLYSDELGLEITTEPFDAQFMLGNEPIVFATDRKGGWLDDQLNQMSRAANTELRRMHSENLLKCRAQYFALVSQFCEDIQAMLDYTDPSTVYGKQYELLGDQYQEDLENLSDRVLEKKRYLTEQYEQRIRDASDRAAADAAQEYRERYGKQQSDRIYSIEAECREEVKDQLQDAIREMNDMRRREAAQRLDAGVAAALKAVTDMYITLQDAERARYQELQKEMTDFISENRENEVFRIKTLAEEQAQSDKANAVMAEYAAKMEALKRQFEGQEALLKSQIDTQARQHAEAMKAAREQHQHELQVMKDRLTTSQNESDSLRGQIVHMDEVKDKQYEARINELAGEREAFSRKYEHLADLQKKTGGIIIVAAVVGIIAALAVGFAVGMFMTRGDSNQIQNIQLPDGYVLVQNDDGTARVVPEEQQLIIDDGSSQTGQIPDSSQSGNESGPESGQVVQQEQQPDVPVIPEGQPDDAAGSAQNQG